MIAGKAKRDIPNIGLLVFVPIVLVLLEKETIHFVDEMISNEGSQFLHTSSKPSPWGRFVTSISFICTEKINNAAEGFFKY